MRCPKCGYISFDRLEFCLKCKKDVSAASEALQGGVFHVTPPVFLNLQSEEDRSDEYDLVAEGEGSEDEVVDGELDILIEESEEENESGSPDLEVSQVEEQETEIAIDPSLFDADVEIEDEIFENQLDSLTEEGTGDFEIEMPEELVDMSDLAPPSPSEGTETSDLNFSDDLDSLSIDLDSLEFDLDLDTHGGNESVGSTGGEEEVSLGDIDFSDTISGPGEEKQKKPGAMDMDDDLNFDLDLGGLSIHDDK